MNEKTSTNQTAPKVFEIIDGNTLMAQEYEPLQFAVEKILPHGVFILAGSGKIGKSWLSLDLCVNVATGGNIACPTSRRIIVENVLELVRDTIRSIADYAKMDKAALEKAIREMLATQQTDVVKAQQKRLAVCRTRHGELERLLNKIYEDYALGRLPEKRYESLLKTYGDEQGTLENEIMEIQSAVEKYEDDSGRAERFMKLVERYTDFEEITPIMIHEFVEKIVVHSKENQYVQSSPQRIEIHLNFIGEFELPNTEREATPEELAEQERIEKVREYDRQRYQKRKAAGYYDKQKAEPKKEKKTA